MIKPPFSNYHRAKLERLVRHGFEAIEYTAASLGPEWQHQRPIMDANEFMVLVAASEYLRTTEEKGDGDV